MRKGFVETLEDVNYNGETHTATRLTEAGWSWIERNEELFVIQREVKEELSTDDVPF